MRSILTCVLFICTYMICNQLHAMDKKKIQKPIILSDIWQQASHGIINEKEINRLLQANVIAIAYGEKSVEKKITLLNNLFTQAFCAGRIQDPFEKQFHGITFTCDNNEPRNILISHSIEFASIMEFATSHAGNNFLLEQAVKTAMLLKDMPGFQKKINIALVKALDNGSGCNTERLEIFKKYGVSFNILLEDGKNLLHRYGLFPQTVIWLLENTEIDGNKQDDKGNTLAHHSLWSIHTTRPLLAKLLNAFIRKNISPIIRNKKGKTPLNIAMKQYNDYKSMDETRTANKWQSYANLFSQLETQFNAKTQCFLAGIKFILLDDGETIELMRE